MHTDAYTAHVSMCNPLITPVCMIHARRYANRAKAIKNAPRQNNNPQDAVVQEYQNEINRWALPQYSHHE